MSVSAGFHPSYYADDSSYYDDYYGYDDDNYDYYDDGSYDDSYDHDGFYDDSGNYYQHDGYGNYYDEDNDAYYDDSYDHGYDQDYDHPDYNVNNYYDSHNYNSNYTNAPNHSRSMSNHYYGGGGRGPNHPQGYGYGNGGRGGGYGGGYGSRYQPAVDESHDHEDGEQFEFHDAQQEQYEEPHIQEAHSVPEQLTRSATVGPSPESLSSTPRMDVLGRAHSVMWRSPTPRLNSARQQNLPQLQMPDVPESGHQQKSSPLAIFHNRFWKSSVSPSSSRPRTPLSATSYYTPLEEPYQQH